MLHRIPHLIPIPAMQCITREQCTEYGLILKFIKKREGHNSAFREKRIKRYRIYYRMEACVRHIAEEVCSVKGRENGRIRGSYA